MKRNKWEGQIVDIPMEYESVGNSEGAVKPVLFSNIGVSDEILVDKIDCLVAASSGILTAMLDVLWVGEFSLRYAQDIGTEQINNLVIAIAQKNAIARGKPAPKSDLKSCIKYLEKEYPLASDRLINEFGGGYHHHLRDFSHHASPFGLISSILNQFTEKGYGTDTAGNIIKPEICGSDAIGKTFEDKITLGIISWFFHLVSDMAGSSSSTGRGTGIPGPILSLAKVLSATPLFRELRIRYKDDDIGFSIWVSKLFNGTAFEHTSHTDVIRFDLRTEIGIANLAVKQSIPVLINQCIVRCFYFVRRLAQDFSEKDISTIADLTQLDAKRFLPFNNRTIAHMITISTGVFSVVDGADAIIRAKVNNPNDSSKMISDTLLRLNFIGIGAFAISIKNEIKYAVQDMRGMMGRKTKAQQLLEQKNATNVIRENLQYIEVSVEMDNRNLYEYIFADLTNMVALSKEKLLVSHSSIGSSIGNIFDLGEGNFGVYQSIVRSNEARAIRAVETLVVRMCEQNNIPFVYYPVSPSFARCYFDTQANSRPFQMIRIEDGKRVGYVFCDADQVQRYIVAFCEGAYEVDAIKIVRLNVPDQSAYKLFYEKPNNDFVKRCISTRIITVKELFDELFGEDEYSVFAEYVNKFNIKAKEIIGFNTVLAPTDDAIANFKAKTGVMLSDFPYADSIPSDIYYSQTRILLGNYLDRKLWRAMIGTSDFALSFISSEWSYHVYQLTENLDMTGTVAGYLKSIEQLLHSVLLLFEDKKISIKSRDGRIIEFAAENEDQIDLTLGSLEVAIQHNGHILDVSPYMKRYLVDTIGEWRTKQRNGYFHKHNLCSKERVDEIRTKAIYLYFLILGSCTIRDDQLEKLGICEENSINIFSYDGFVSWLETILNYGLPADTVAISLMLYDTRENTWSLQLHGLKTFDKAVPFYEWVDNFNSGHFAYEWERTSLEKDTVQEVSAAVRKYLEFGAHRNKLSAYNAVSVSCRYHTEFPFLKQD